MAEQPVTTHSIQNGRGVVGYKGTKAGQSFPTSAEKSESDDWTAYKIEKKLSFAAQKKDHASDFAAWRKKRAVKAGQSAAVK